MAKKKIVHLVEDILENFLKENGLELYNCKFVKEGPDWFLKVYIDKNQHDLYIDTEDCEKVSRYLSEILDENDPIEQNYYLEVSSPGLDREISTEEHFKRYTGELVDLKLYKSINGNKEFTGKLLGLKNNEIIIELENCDELSIDENQVSKVSLAVII